MMLRGRIFKDSDTGKWWAAEAPTVGVYTQGTSRKDAFEMLADAVESGVNRKGFKVTVSEAGGEDVVIEASDPAALALYVLKVQRSHHGLSLADVAEKLGANSRNAYARYEQGGTVPTITKFVELLAVVAPDLVLKLEPRALTGARLK